MSAQDDLILAPVPSTANTKPHAQGRAFLLQDEEKRLTNLHQTRVRPWIPASGTRSPSRRASTELARSPSSPRPVPTPDTAPRPELCVSWHLTTGAPVSPDSRPARHRRGLTFRLPCRRCLAQGMGTGYDLQTAGEGLIDRRLTFPSPGVEWRSTSPSEGLTGNHEAAGRWGSWCTAQLDRLWG